MSYEWARMSEPPAVMPAFLFCLAGSLGAVMLASWGNFHLGAAWMAACALASALRRRSLTGVIETAGGALYVGLPCATLLWLRGQGDEGLATVLVLFLVIWTADVFAYFGGKLVGGPKVAVGLSPNKTWSGIFAGTAAGACAGLLCGATVAHGAAGQGAWLLVGAVVALTGLIGDLFESFLKRRFGVKDASKIIPGHGGALDRLDGLMASTLLTGAVAALAPGLMHYLLGPVS